MDKLIKKERNKEGITIIALVITIIVLLILAGITVYSLFSENGILSMAERARKNHIDAQEKELSDLDKLYSSILVATNDSSQITIKVEDLKTLIEKTVEEKLAQNSQNTQPVGMVFSYMGNTPPDGYLKCDGQVYNIVDYPNLAKQMQEQFGKCNYFGGDGETTFAVPDLRGEFLRGTGTAKRNTGSGVNVGLHQDPTHIPNIQNVYGMNTDGRMTMPASKTQLVSIYNQDLQINSSVRYNSASSGATVTNEAGWWATVRPTTTSVLYCIKY